MASEYPQGAEESEYKGSPILCLNPESPFKFQFGLSKAQLILEHIDDIRQFVEKQIDNENKG